MYNFGHHGYLTVKIIITLKINCDYDGNMLSLSIRSLVNNLDHLPIHQLNEQQIQDKFKNHLIVIV